MVQPPGRNRTQLYRPMRIRVRHRRYNNVHFFVFTRTRDSNSDHMARWPAANLLQASALYHTELRSPRLSILLATFTMLVLFETKIDNESTMLHSNIIQSLAVFRNWSCIGRPGAFWRNTAGANEDRQRIFADDADRKVGGASIRHGLAASPAARAQFPQQLTGIRHHTRRHCAE